LPPANNYNVRSPILLIIYNRPDLTRKVFHILKRVKPRRLYIAADGARENIRGDNNKVADARAIINHIDWKCDVRSLLRDENYGCKKQVSSAISWFFDNEEEGIIIEDDCLPSIDFFKYCDFMLQRFRFDNRIMMITGTNFQGVSNCREDFFYSNHYSVWGWATWRRAWTFYDVKMDLWRFPQIRKDINFRCQNSWISHYLRYFFRSLHLNSIDTWDIQWAFACLIQAGLCVTPKKNLVTNIGILGTHSNQKITNSHFLKTYPLDVKKYPKSFLVNSNYDQYLFERNGRIPFVKGMLIDLLLYLKILNFVKKLRKQFNA
jgi:hypothetical protein